MEEEEEEGVRGGGRWRRKKRRRRKKEQKKVDGEGEKEKHEKQRAWGDRGGKNKAKVESF